MKSHGITNRIIALAVFIIASVVYLLTAGPSIAFWDCGEFLASAGCLGIPHPPGTPLLIPIGRVFLLLFSFLSDPGFRANLIAVFGSAIVAMLIYSIIVRAMIMAFGEPDTLWKRLVLYCSGFMGGLFCAFSNTFWFCSLEASEQCNFCLIPVALTLWLALVWAQSKDERFRDRILLLITYISFTGIGMHMVSMITSPAIFLFIMLVDKKKREDWRLWVGGILISSIMYNLSWFIVACSVVFLITLAMMTVKGRHQEKWRFVFWFSFFAMLGFSNHIYLPVRSALNPLIDENHPVTWEAFTQMLDRKQYGSESMVQRSFWRRGTLAHQFGIEGNMGYGGFHITQFFHFSALDTQKNFMDNTGLAGVGMLLVYLVPTFFMLFGWYYFYRKHRNVAILLILVTLLTTIIFAWYMNFADGLRPERRDFLAWVNAGKPGQMPVEHREVRVRDYFYNAGFMFFGMWLGMAAGCLLLALSNNKNKLLRTTIAPLCLVLFAVSPALPLTQNYAMRDRHRNWVPFDYAYNLLMSCDKDAILITNGDNDTFPLWAIQEAFGIRRDVRLVNLSLLNTDWYIKQLKDVEPKVPISFSSSQIDVLQPELNPFTEATRYSLPQADITVQIPGRKQLNALRVQDKLVLNIVDSNKWRKPVYFAVTVSEDNFMGLDPYLQMQGLAYRILPHAVAEDQRFDLDRTIFFLNKVYRFQALKDEGLYIDETVKNLLNNYTACFIQTAYAFRTPMAKLKSAMDSLQKAQVQKGVQKTALPSADLIKLKQDSLNADLQTVTEMLDKCVSIVPWDWRPRMLRQEFLMNYGKIDQAQLRAGEALKVDPNNPEFLKMAIQTYESTGNPAKAIPILKRLLPIENDPWPVCMELARNYGELNQYDSAISVVARYNEEHPGDRRAAEVLNDLNRKKTGKPK
jgi:tetratricopeptide (TPR) repeat protein